MVIEESSVVAAASHAAKFWAMHGGFHTRAEGIEKTGQIHFTWNGTEEVLHQAFRRHEEHLIQAVGPLIHRMEQRGGGVEKIEIRSASPHLPDTYQLFVTFRTANAMGANFINSVLEKMAGEWESRINSSGTMGALKVIMSILSNYTPECRVTCYVEGDYSIFREMDPHMSGEQFALTFKQAVDIAVHDPYRAVTHNKGIFNGMDAVILATGNDFRAVEAGGHAFAARSGTYRSLSQVELSEKSFRFSLEVPVAVGSVGGLTGTHPLAKVSLEILGQPDAEQLMQYTAAAGLANHFSAIRSLITTGIQKGHMKMHLGNILRQLGASPEESASVTVHFKDRQVSFANVSSYLESIRNPLSHP